MTENFCTFQSYPHSHTGEEEKFIFVSYSHDDRAIVYPILEHLQQRGFRIRYDQDIPFSPDMPSGWIQYVAKQIKNCELCLLFLSENSNRSRYVEREVSFAFQKNVPCVTVNIDEPNKFPLNEVIEFSVDSGHSFILNNFKSTDDFIDVLSEIPTFKQCQTKRKTANVFSKFHSEITRKLYGGKDGKNKTYNKNKTKGDRNE